MSTGRSRVNAEVENSSVGVVKSGVPMGDGLAPRPRRTLQEIQPCVPPQDATRRLMQAAPNGKTTQRRQTALAGCSSRDAYALMVQEDPPPEYWQQLAEQRRRALAQALQENKRLRLELVQRDQEIAELRRENEDLSEVAAHVDFLATMIERLTGERPSLEEEAQVEEGEGAAVQQD
ncbi:geminin [Petromyzon marinus]|uniref:Geminin-like isoform X2 n=1 Tax=Petromyzon marinus TaxID=7757 RepID=A0AAJ7TIF0_PETMA|nr:geminin-like isoform X2 [Petromyzon marinus]